MNSETASKSKSSPENVFNKLDPTARMLIIASLIAGAGSVGYVYWRLSLIDTTLSGIESRLDEIDIQIDAIETQVGAMNATPTPWEK